MELKNPGMAARGYRNDFVPHETNIGTNNYIPPSDSEERMVPGCFELLASPSELTLTCDDFPCVRSGLDSTRQCLLQALERPVFTSNVCQKFPFGSQFFGHHRLQGV